MSFEIVSAIEDVEIIAGGNAIRDSARLGKQCGQGRWRKFKGVALIRLANGQIGRVELHGYEAHGIGKKEFKRKRYLDQTMKARESTIARFAICIDNREYPASLELHKVYRVLSDQDAEPNGDLRIIDESGEDHL